MGPKESRRRVNQNKEIIEDPYGNLLSYKQLTKYNLWKKTRKEIPLDKAPPGSSGLLNKTHSARCVTTPRELLTRNTPNDSQTIQSLAIVFL